MYTLAGAKDHITIHPSSCSKYIDEQKQSGLIQISRNSADSTGCSSFHWLQ